LSSFPAILVLLTSTTTIDKAHWRSNCIGKLRSGGSEFSEPSFGVIVTNPYLGQKIFIEFVDEFAYQLLNQGRNTHPRDHSDASEEGDHETCGLWSLDADFPSFL
jgi:hypothetical protein